MVKLKTLCEKYLAEHSWLALSTKQVTDRAFRFFVTAAGNMMIDRVDYRACERYKSWLLKTGRAKTSANIYLRSLRPVFGWAILIGLLEPDSNPMNGVKQLKVTQRPIRIFEDYEFARMLRFAPNERWKAILLLARTAGLRRGEVLNVTSGNVRNGFIFVEPKKDTETTWAWEPKGKEIRKVPLVAEVEGILNQLPCHYPCISNRRYERILKLKDAGVLSETVRGCPEQNFRRTFVTIQKKAFGGQVGTFHDLRKTYITQMANSLPDYFVCKLSGHSNVKTMTTYYTCSRESQYEQARLLAQEGIKNGTQGLQSAPQGGFGLPRPDGR